MEATALEYGLKNVSSSGHTLNVKEVSMLNASLAKLQSVEKCGRIFLWGKLFGNNQNYFIAYGVRDADVEFPSKQFYCATDSDYVFSGICYLHAIKAIVSFTNLVENRFELNVHPFRFRS